MSKSKKPEELHLICGCARCYAAAHSGGRAARGSARVRDYDLRVFIDMEQAKAERAVRLIAQHGVAWLVEDGSVSIGVATLLAYHSGAILLGNPRPKTCVLVRPKGYAAEWCESVDAAREALKTPKHKSVPEPETNAQLDLFAEASS